MENCWVVVVSTQQPGFQYTVQNWSSFTYCLWLEVKGLVDCMGRRFISAVSSGYEQLYLESFPELGTAVNMYEKAGFKHLEKPLGNSGHHACTIWMLKNFCKQYQDIH